MHGSLMLLTSYKRRLVGHDAVRGFIAAVPILIGFVPFALLFGTQAAQKGLTIFEVPLMTGMNFGGGSEFAAIALWSSPPSVLTVVMVTLLINSRHLLMGASLAPYLQHLPKRRVLPALFFMCDESWAMSMADIARRRQTGILPVFSLPYYAGVAGALYFTWVFFTGLGAWVGPMLGDVTHWGFDMAFPAVFLVLLRGMWKGARAACPWLVSLSAAVLTYHYFPGAAYVPVGAIAGIVTILMLSARQ